jgi:HEAT repeats
LTGTLAGSDPDRSLFRFPRRLLFLGLVALVTIRGFPSRAHARGHAIRDPFASATAAVVGDRSEKVRVQAALVLGYQRDSRATPFLIRALADPSPTVRAMAAKALGDIGDESARPALEVAAGETIPLVHRHAAAALQALTDRQSLFPIAVKPMGDKTNRASVGLRERMRGFVVAELSGFKKRTVAGYTVDGSIKVLSISGRSDVIEVKCGVELVLSTGANAIVMMSSGEAIVQRQRRQFRPVMQPSMELEALEHAVRGASDELRQHFAANGP